MGEYKDFRANWYALLLCVIKRNMSADTASMLMGTKEYSKENRCIAKQ